MASKIIISKKIVYGIGIVFAFGALFLGCNEVHAATLQINSNSTILAPGNTMTLAVVLNSEGIAINNAEAKVVFPTDLLEVVSISKAGSIFSLWVEEPTFSNASGIVTFNGGVPTPGFTGSSGTALSIVVRAKASGQASVTFSDAAIRANDGLGTDVLNTKTGKTISIVKKEEPVIKKTATQESAPLVTALQVVSPTHPSQELWYKDNNPLFKWKVPTGADAVQTGIDNHTSGSPRVTFSPAISERTVEDLEDGVWYFKVRARKGGEWGPTSTYITRIDKTVPQKNEVTFSYDDSGKILYIKADIVDETSGLDYYEIYINDALVRKVLSTEFVDGNYSLSFGDAGNNTVKLVAVDRAGNKVESSGSFEATGVLEESQPVASTNEQLLITVGVFAMPAIYFVGAILFVILILVLGAFILGRSYGKLRNRSKVRTALVKGDNTKVLLLLKKRLEKHLEILQHTRHSRILSKEEKEIKEAIEGDLDEVDRAIEEQRLQK